MHRLTRAQLAARKKRRLIQKPIRRFWRLKLKEIVREYNTYRSVSLRS